MPIDLTHVWDSVNAGLLILLQGGAIVIGGYLIYALHKYGKFLSAAQQEKLANIVNSGLNAAINYAMAVATEQEKKVQPSTDSVITKIAAQYAADHFGTTLDKMGKSPSDVAQMILARIPPPPNQTDTTGATITRAIVTTEPIPPVQEPKT